MKVDANDYARKKGRASLKRKLQTMTAKTAPLKRSIPYPAPLHRDAFHGLAGRIISSFGPHTEADPAAMLVHLLVAFGNQVGRNPHLKHGDIVQRANLFAVIVGDTSTGKKGTAWNAIRRLFEESEDSWLKYRVKNGLTSGEGIINAVRDADATRDDIGVEDKRLQIVETEFSRVLKQTTREGNILSDIIRLAWDGHDLATLSKQCPQSASNPHISILGHITPHELKYRMAGTEFENGFANRFLWACSTASKELPEGGALSPTELALLRGEVQDALRFAHGLNEPLRMSCAASDLWGRNGGQIGLYSELSHTGGGLADSICAPRAPQQVLRLALIYALLDKVTQVQPEHLRAALAVWRYCEQSVRHIFGDKLNNPDAQRILDRLRDTPGGMRRNAIRETIFKGNKSSDEIENALDYLKTHGKADFKSEGTGGRTAQRWFVTE